MTLSCGCDYDGDAAWYFEEVGFSTLKNEAWASVPVLQNSAQAGR